MDIPFIAPSVNLYNEVYQSCTKNFGGDMGAIHAFIKRYQNKCNESPVIIEYSHLKKRWRINTRVMVNPSDIGCVYDPDLETYKLTSRRKLKN